MTGGLSFPPLMRGEPTPPGVHPMVAAARVAAAGCEPGLIVHTDGGPVLSAALVLAPEAPLGDAMAMSFAAALGLSDALGALGPPETAIHLEWPARFRLNGASCGGVRAAAAHDDPAAEPDWLVVGFDLPLTAEAEPGADPGRTTLFEEGCADIDPYRLLESWSRHCLIWINAWLDDGMARLHRDWVGRAHGLGEEVDFALSDAAIKGRFLGIDERGGMLLREGDATRLIPLTEMLEHPC